MLYSTFLLAVCFIHSYCILSEYVFEWETQELLKTSHSALSLMTNHFQILPLSLFPKSGLELISSHFSQE